MKTIRHRRLMRVLLQQCNGTYAKAALWLKGSKTYGDGTYDYKRKCKTCKK